MIRIFSEFLAIQALNQRSQEAKLRSRIVGYHPVTGQTGEWNTWGAEQLPDLSAPMVARTGPAPGATDRLTTTAGLLRDPAKEQAVIDYYARLHEVVAEAVLYFAKVVKEAVNRRLICGTFYGYLLEQVEIQEGGYLEFKKVLACPDLDYLAVTCSYQGKNGFDAFGSPTMLDGGGNAYGHSRGVGGSGAFRALTESIRRSGTQMISSRPSGMIAPRPTHRICADIVSSEFVSMSTTTRIRSRTE